MSTDDLPVCAYEGTLEDATFLVSLLESAGIATNLVGPSRHQPARIYVLTRDAPAARDFVVDFESRRGRPD